MVEPEAEECLGVGEALEGAKPFDSSLDFAVEAFDKSVFAYATIYEVSLLVFFPVPAHDFVNGNWILPKAVSYDFLWLCTRSDQCVLHDFSGVFKQVCLADMPCEYLFSICTIYDPKPMSRTFNLNVCLICMPSA